VDSNIPPCPGRAEIAVQCNGCILDDLLDLVLVLFKGTIDSGQRRGGIFTKLVICAMYIRSGLRLGDIWPGWMEMSRFLGKGAEVKVNVQNKCDMKRWKKHWDAGSNGGLSVWYGIC
jgi:hypothetical protein